jgi:hypothetical protein
LRDVVQVLLLLGSILIHAVTITALQCAPRLWPGSGPKSRRSTPALPPAMTPTPVLHRLCGLPLHRL